MAAPPSREIHGERAGGRWNELLERTARFDSFVRFLDGCPHRTHQRDLELLAVDCGVTITSVRSIIARAKLLGILDVTTNGSPILGIGRFPNTYRLRISLDDWLAQREDLIAARKERERAAKRKARAVAKEQRRKDRISARVREAEEARRIAALPEVVWPISSTPPPAPALEVDAWLDAPDY